MSATLDKRCSSAFERRVRSLSRRELQEAFEVRFKFFEDGYEIRSPFNHFDFYLLGEKIGFSTISVDTMFELIDWDEFHPLRRAINLKNSGLGIGTLAHTQLLIELIDMHNLTPKFSIKHNVYISADRRHHLKKMGLESLYCFSMGICSGFNEMPILPYLERSLNYAVNERGFVFASASDYLKPKPLLK